MCAYGFPRELVEDLMIPVQEPQRRLRSITGDMTVVKNKLTKARYKRRSRKDHKQEEEFAFERMPRNYIETEH